MFVAVAARFSDLIYLSLRDRELASKDKSHSTFAAIYRGDKGRCGNTVTWDTAAMCVVKKPAEKLVATSIDGDIFTYAGGKVAAEKIAPKLHGISGMATIAGYAYACGTDREVFKRVDEGKWEPLHAPDAFHLEGMHGFTSIAGYSESDIYAAGWKGEIWHYDGAKWRQIDSPTNEKLSVVVCGEDGQVYIGGRHGMMIRGRGVDWEVINKEGYKGDIWGMQWFNGCLYASTLERVCELKGDGLVPVHMGDDLPNTCYHLTLAEGMMWSVGTDDIFSFDGRKWTRIE